MQEPPDPQTPTVPAWKTRLLQSSWWSDRTPRQLEKIPILFGGFLTLFIVSWVNLLFQGAAWLLPCLAYSAILRYCWLKLPPRV